MKKEQMDELLQECGAVLKGHFLLTSGLHSDTYVEKFKLLQYPRLTEKMCKEIANYFENKKPHLILGAATGGIIISHAVGRELSVKSIFAERVDGKLVLRRGFNIEKGERVLVVDDVVTTGGSIYELLDLVEEYGGKLLGVGTLIDRSGDALDFGVDYYTLVRYNIPTYKPENCPLCASNIPMTERGRTGK
ncbi:MAG: orotate phosphoribosyltransferase [Candidatus Marinimicrobia bacterium]|nr:orotate phosphoribosyltransferase [Candidatus Neomarinimicrobiota bacterium]